MLSSMLKLSIARFIRWYESVRSCWTTLLLVCVFISVQEKLVHRGVTSQEISKRLTFFLKKAHEKNTKTL